MTTRRAIVFYSPSTGAPSTGAVVELGDDGAVSVTYPDEDPALRDELERVGLVLGDRKVRPADGIDFWRALAKAYAQSTYVAVVDVH